VGRERARKGRRFWKLKAEYLTTLESAGMGIEMMRTLASDERRVMRAEMAASI
jgi:hypothetical protein